MPVASDDFNRANGALGANWTQWSHDSNPLAISGNTVYCTGTSNPDSGAYWNADTFGDDQFSEVEVDGALTSGSWVGVAVRQSADFANNYLLIYFNNAGSYVLWLFRKDANGAGGYTALGSSLALGGPLSAGDVIRIEAEGSTIRGLLNGVEQLSRTDATYTGGAPAIAMFASGTSDSVDNWQGGDLTVTPLTLDLGKVPAGAAVRGVDLAVGGALTLALGRIYGAGSFGGGNYGGGVYGGNVGGIDLTQTALSLGKVGSSTAVRGVDLSQSGAVTLTLGRVASPAAVRGITLLLGSSTLYGTVVNSDRALGSVTPADTARGSVTLTETPT